MNAVFMHKNAILRDSHIAVDAEPSDWALSPATIEALRMLLVDERLLFILDTIPALDGDDEQDELRALRELVRQVEAGGGRIDGLIVCPHKGSQDCACWDETPALLALPQMQFGLDMSRSYLIADGMAEVEAAYGAAVRPMLLLGERSVVEVFGDRHEKKDCTNVPDLTTAAHDITLEDEIIVQLGTGRPAGQPMDADDVLLLAPGRLPLVVLTSDVARGLVERVLKTKAQLRDIGRWLTFFVLGALGLALGVAYLLTHLYRVQPFPQWIYYITLQFISRPVRGAIFVALGLGVMAVAVHSFYGTTKVWRRKQD